MSETGRSNGQQSVGHFAESGKDRSLRVHVRAPEPSIADRSRESGMKPASLLARVSGWRGLTSRPATPSVEAGHQFGKVPVAPPAGEQEASEENKPEEMSLDQMMREATRGEGEPLPHASELEGRLGRPLAGVRVYHGPAARAVLKKLGARAAVHGNELLLSEPDPGLPVLLHEAVHLAQVDGNRSSESSRPLKVEGATSPAEVEAHRATAKLQPSLPSRGIRPQTPSVQLDPQAVALLRNGETSGGTDVAAPPQHRPGIESWVVASEHPAARRQATPAAPTSESRRESTSTSRPAGETPTRTAPASAGPASTTPTPAAGTVPTPAVQAPGAAVEGAQAGAAQEAAAGLESATDVAGLVDNFATAAPTVKARQAAELDSRAEQLSQQEADSLEQDLPQVHAEMTGTVDPDAAPPSLPSIADAPVPHAAEELESAPPAAENAEVPAAPVNETGGGTLNNQAVSTLYRSLNREGQIQEQDVTASLESVSTSDPSIVTNPGAAPQVPTDGASDPGRIEAQASNGVSQAQAAQEAARQAVLSGPGPEVVQPARVEESQEINGLNRPPLEAAPTPAGPQQYLDLNLPPNVQTQFDQDQQEPMQASMEQARTQVAQAAETRDRQRDEQVSQAEEQQRQLSADADREQQQQVQQARGQIETGRQDSLNQQNEAVQSVQQQSDERRGQDREQIDNRVRDDQSQIQEHYDQADRDAQHEVQQGERQAEDRRASAERDAENQSWWDRAVSFVRSAFNALVSAIGAIFDAVKNAVNRILTAVRDFANRLIEAASRFIQAAIAAFGTFLKGLVDNLLGSIFPELARALDNLIDSAVSLAQRAVQAVANRLRAAVNALVDRLRNAINAVLGAFQAAINMGLSLVRAALTGDWSEFLRLALEAVLNLIGVDPADFYAFVGRARETFQIIIDDPGAFVGHLIDAFVLGVRNFADNFLTHLRNGIIAWLTGALGDAGITMPEHFDLMGVLSLVQQILGLTWDRLRQKAVRLIGERNVARLEFIFSYIETLVTGGWPALFERIQQDLSNLADMVLDGIKSFLVQRVIMAAITRLATMFNPVGAIVQLVLAAWNFYTFLRDQLARIIQVVRTVVDAIGNIARGVIEPAAQSVERVLANLLPLAISLLANLLGLGGIGERVREVVEAVRARIDQAIDSLINRVLSAFRGGGGGQQQAAPAGDIQDQARSALLERLHGDHTHEQVAAIARTVEEEYRAQGLHHIIVGPPEADGGFQIFTEASPRRRATRLVPRRSRGRVVMHATLNLTGEEPALPEFPAVPGTMRTSVQTRNESGELEDVTPGVFFQPVGGVTAAGRGTPSAQRQMRIRSGGVVHRPVSDRPNEVRTSSWNTGEEPDSRSNNTHAERQFETWLDRQPAPFRQRISSIGVDINMSPCKLCSQSLSNVARMSPNLNTAHLHYTTVYTTPPNATTQASLARMGEKWTSDGPPAPQSDEHDAHFEIEQGG